MGMLNHDFSGTSRDDARSQEGRVQPLNRKTGMVLLLLLFLVLSLLFLLSLSSSLAKKNMGRWGSLAYI